MNIDLKLLTEQANGLGQLLFKEFGQPSTDNPRPEWADGLMNLLCHMEHVLHSSSTITLIKTKEEE
jgi:hypothetical protein